MWLLFTEQKRTGNSVYAELNWLYQSISSEIPLLAIETNSGNRIQNLSLAGNQYQMICQLFCLPTKLNCL